MASWKSEGSCGASEGPWRWLATVLLLLLLRLLLPLGRQSHFTLGNCPFPPLIDNGEIKDKFKSLRYFRYGLVIEYICYYETDKIPSITCQKDSTWTKSKVICKGRTCPDPGHLTHGVVQAPHKEYLIGSRVTFLCKLGFKLIGHNTSDCVLHGKDAKWSNLLPTCERLLCPPPPDIADGSHNGTGNPYAYGAVITYLCKKSFSLIGSHSVSCDLEGNGVVLWKGKPPVCKEIQCENPVIENGIILNGLRQSYTYGDNVTLECKIGYFMVGSFLSHCEENSTWYPDLPFCKKIDPSVCGAPFISSGSVHPLQSNYTIGMIISVTCNPRYSFLDETVEMNTVCEGYNLWTPPVQPCLFRTSPDIFELAINHGKIILGKKNTYEPGDNVTVQCSAGYTLVGPSEIRYIGGKRWLPGMPSCSLSFVFIFLIVACVLVLLWWPARSVYLKYCSA